MRNIKSLLISIPISEIECRHQSYEKGFLLSLAMVIPVDQISIFMVY